MSETFKPIPGFPNYAISDRGTVRRNDGLIMTPSVPRHRLEYPAVMLRVNGERKRRNIHRLMLLTWVGQPPFEKAETRHLDGNHLNYSLDNLVWGSRTENARDKHRHGTTARGERHGARKVDRGGTKNPNSILSENDVAEILRLSRQGLPSRRIAKQMGISQACAWRVIAGKTYSACLKAIASQEQAK